MYLKRYHDIDTERTEVIVLAQMNHFADHFGWGGVGAGVRSLDRPIAGESH